VPGRIGTCRSATSAVSLRRGSTTTSFPPRARSARTRPRKSGTVNRLPFETSGFVPSSSRYSQRSMSGTGMLSDVPNINPQETCFGNWSTVLAL
jgi:hypothetical protein